MFPRRNVIKNVSVTQFYVSTLNPCKEVEIRSEDYTSVYVDVSGWKHISFNCSIIRAPHAEVVLTTVPLLQNKRVIRYRTLDRRELNSCVHYVIGMMNPPSISQFICLRWFLRKSSTTWTFPTTMRPTLHSEVPDDVTQPGTSKT